MCSLITLSQPSLKGIAHTAPRLGRARKLRGGTRALEANRFGRHIWVLSPSSGIKEHDAILPSEESCREQLIVRGGRCSSFGRQENSFASCPVHKRCPGSAHRAERAQRRPTHSEFQA